jgi:hypothetical protein
MSERQMEAVANVLTLLSVPLTMAVASDVFAWMVVGTVGLIIFIPALYLVAKKHREKVTKRLKL